MAPKTDVPARYRVLASLVPVLAILVVLAMVTMLTLRARYGGLALQKRTRALALLHLERARSVLDVHGRYARLAVPDFADLGGLALEAREMAFEAAERAPDAEEAHRVLGLALEAEYNLVEAGASFEEAAALHPSSPANYHLGRLLTRRVLRARLAGTPTHPRDADTLGGLAVRALNVAVNPHEEFDFQPDPQHRFVARTCVAYLRDEFARVPIQAKVAWQGDKTDWLVPTITGMAWLKLEKHDEAIEQLEGAVRAAPGYADPYAALAAGYLAAGRRTDAIGALNNAVKADAHFFEAYLLRARVLVEDRRFEEARTDLEACAKLRGDVAEVPLLLGRATFEAWRRSAEKDAVALDTAEAALTKAAGLGTQAEAYLWRARVRAAKGLHPAAESDLALAMTLPGTEPLEERAALYERSGRWAEAAKDYATAIGKTKEPAERAALRASRARALLEAGDAEGAVAEYAALVADDPRNPSLRAGHARSLAAAGRPDDALEALEGAPATSRIREARARILLAKNDPAGAVTEATAAFEADPQNAEALITRAEAYGRSGNREAALADLRKAGELRPDLAGRIASVEKRISEN